MSSPSPGVDTALDEIRNLPTDSSTAWFFPGQGAQAVGMGIDLVEHHSIARATFDYADEILGFNLSGLCFEGPAEKLMQTEFTQPALVVHAIAALLTSWSSGIVDKKAHLVAGHSLGEYAALIVSGACSFADGLRLVRKRGQLMQEACEESEGTMAAVLGLEVENLEKICTDAGAHLCNVNAPGNITIGGTMTSVQTASDLAVAQGASKVVPLVVAGAFHTPLMQSAADGMKYVLAETSFQPPEIDVVSNVTGKVIPESKFISNELHAQITQPVLWLDGVLEMMQLGITNITEFGPGRVLTGAAKRTNRDLILRNIGKNEDLISS